MEKPHVFSIRAQIRPIRDGSGPFVTEQAPFVTLVSAASRMDFPEVFSIRDGSRPFVTDLLPPDAHRSAPIVLPTPSFECFAGFSNDFRFFTRLTLVATRPASL